MTGTGDWLVTHAEALARKSQDVLHRGTLRMKLHTPVMPNEQTPHEQDELYLILKGHGTFTKAGETLNFGPGDAILVEAGAEHAFETISEDTLLWVLFWGPPGGEQDTD